MTARGFSDWYYGWEYYLSERGTFGRSDSEWEADLHFGYPIRLGTRIELNLLLDILLSMPLLHSHLVQAEPVGSKSSCRSFQ